MVKELKGWLLLAWVSTILFGHIALAGVLTSSSILLCSRKIARESEPGGLQGFQRAFKELLEVGVSESVIGQNEIEQLLKTSGRTLLNESSSTNALLVQSALDAIFVELVPQGKEHEADRAALEIVSGLVSHSEQAKKEVSLREGKLRERHYRQPKGVSPNEDGVTYHFPTGTDEIIAHLGNRALFAFDLAKTRFAPSDVWEERPILGAGKDASDTTFYLAPQISPNGKILICLHEGLLSAVEVSSGNVLWQKVEAKVERVRFFPQSERFVLLTKDEGVQLVDARTGISEVLRIAKNSQRGVYFTTTERYAKGLFNDVYIAPNENALALIGNHGDMYVRLHPERHVGYIHNCSPNGFLGFRGDDSVLTLWFEQLVYRFTYDSQGYGMGWNEPYPHTLSAVRVVDENRDLTHAVTKDGCGIGSIKFFDKGDYYLRNFKLGKGEKIRHLHLSRDGMRIALLTNERTFIYTVISQNKWDLVLESKSIFLDRKQSGFSGTGRYFAGVNSKGKFTVISLPALVLSLE